MITDNNGWPFKLKIFPVIDIYFPEITKDDKFCQASEKVIND